MKSIQDWKELYKGFHQDPFNIKVQKYTVPINTFAIFGLLWGIKIPIGNGADLSLLVPFITVALVLYKRLGDKPFISMTVLIGLLVGFISLTENYIPIFDISLILFIICRPFQYYAYRLEGNRPDFVTRIKFLAIVPLLRVLEKIKK
jgi:uncharacterized membrane protein YGL010W